MSPALETAAKNLARDVMLRHVFAFPADMDAEHDDLRRRFGAGNASLVCAVFSRLEFEITAAVKQGMAIAAAQLK